MVAFAKLQELIAGPANRVPRQQFGNRLLRALRRVGIVVMAGYEHEGVLVVDDRCGALVFGVLFVLPIGGADMPVVISILNSFTGRRGGARPDSCCDQNVLIVARDARRRLGHAADDMMAGR